MHPTCTHLIIMGIPGPDLASPSSLSQPPTPPPPPPPPSSTPWSSSSSKQAPQAEPGSLREILVTNHRTRLYIPPEVWTVQHLRLLDCRYITSSTSPIDHKPEPETETQPKSDSTSTVPEAQAQAQAYNAGKQKQKEMQKETPKEKQKQKQERNALFAQRHGQHPAFSLIQQTLRRLDPSWSRLLKQKDRVIRALFPLLIRAAEGEGSARNFDILFQP